MVQGQHPGAFLALMAFGHEVEAGAVAEGLAHDLVDLGGVADEQDAAEWLVHAGLALVSRGRPGVRPLTGLRGCITICLSFDWHGAFMENRTARLTILIDPRKKSLFEEICAEQDLTPSQVVRKLIRQYIIDHAGTRELPDWLAVHGKSETSDS
jgi:hypothetical protein